jgi:outer membrane biogenesis lipoprotein LolB
MISKRVQSVGLKLTAALALVVPALLAGCSHSPEAPIANQSQTQFNEQQAKSAADYAAFMKTHGRPGQ